MLAIDLRILIRELVPAFLGEDWKKYSPRNEPKLAFLAEFDVGFSDYGEDGETDSHWRKYLRILVTQHHELFYSVMDFGSSRYPRAEDFVFDSAHDSCWCEMQFLGQIYFEACQRVAPEKAPRDVHMSVFTGNFGGNSFRLVRVQTAKEPSDGWNYKRKLVVLEEIRK